MIISMINPFLPGGDYSPEGTVLSRDLNRAIDEELGTSILPYMARSSPRCRDFKKFFKNYSHKKILTAHLSFSSLCGRALNFLSMER